MGVRLSFRLIQLIIPWPPGGLEVPSRRLAQAFSESMGQQFLAVNRPSASTMLASQMVPAVKPDGFGRVADRGGDRSDVLQHSLYRWWPSADGADGK